MLSDAMINSLYMLDKLDTLNTLDTLDKFDMLDTFENPYMLYTLDIHLI